MGVPAVPLSELYGVAADYIRARGGQVLLRSAVEPLECSESQVKLRANDTDYIFDYAISAVPFHALGRVLPVGADSDKLQQKVSHLRTVPITGVHLWFDREITPLEHAALLDRNIQWMFQKSNSSPLCVARMAAMPVSYWAWVMRPW